MEMLKKQNWGMIIALLLWCAITLIRVFNHSPWYDEAHAWIIAQELNFVEIIRLMKTEGHTFLWFLCLMPFAKTNFLYPYSMLLLNWLFCFVAILILWLKAPFNNWVKFFISFSFPFLGLYSVVARCYAIGIMSLFALAAMDKSKLNHPNWYALLLVLCANTSLMAIVGATVFGVLFLYDLIKSKKNVILPLIILTIGAAAVLTQLFGASSEIISGKMGINFFKNLIFLNLPANIITLLIYFILLLAFFIKNKIFPVFLVSSYIILFLINCVFPGFIWHHFFYYIYFIISFWLIFDKYEKIKWSKLIVILISIISIFLTFYNTKNYQLTYGIPLNVAKSITNFIKTDFDKSDIIIFNNLAHYSLVPYFYNSNIKFINYCNLSPVSYDTNSFFISDYCYQSPGNKKFGRKIVDEQLDKIIKDKAFIMYSRDNLVGEYHKNPLNIKFSVYMYKQLYKGIYVYYIERN